MALRRDSQQKNSENKSLPAILMKTNMKQSGSGEEEFVADLQDVLDCRSPHVEATAASFMPSS